MEKQYVISKYILTMLYIYLTCFYIVQINGLESSLTFLNNVFVNQPHYIGNILTYNKYILFFSIIISAIGIFFNKKILHIISIFLWIFYSLTFYSIYTPQEEYITIILFTFIISKDNKINKTMKEILFLTLGLTLLFSSSQKFFSESWQSCSAVNSLLHTALSPSFIKDLIIPKYLICFLSYSGIVIQFSAVFLLIRNINLRKYIILVLFIFFFTIPILIIVPSVTSGMLVYLSLLYNINKN